MWDRRAQVTEVVDGDSLKVTLDQGFGDRKDLDLRLFGVWAPEKSQVGGPETLEFVRSWVAARSGATKWPFVVTTIRVRADTHEKKTFDRYLGLLDYGNESLGMAIMEFVARNGYSGGTGA